MARLLGHRQTKGAANRQTEPTATAPHLSTGSTLSGSFSRADIARYVVLVSGCFRALGRTHTTGHKLPVGVTFQFLQAGRPENELNGRYSASNLMTSLPQPGHQQSNTCTTKRTFERQVHSES